MSLALDNSLVAALQQDQRYVGLRAAESLGYLPLGHCPPKQPDLGNLFGRQQSFVMRNPSDIDRVLAIKMPSGPFEVGDDVIRFDAVDMVDHRTVVWVGDKAHPHQPMDMDGLAFPLPEKIDVSVAKFVGAWSENLSVHSSGFQTVTDAVQTSDAAKVTYLVEIPEVCDRYGSPFFTADDIHVAGCLSGSDGLAIKDPLHAPTFGGSAIMASGSNTYNRSIPCQ